MQVEPHISNQKTLARHVNSLPRLPAGGRFDLDTCAGLTLQHLRIIARDERILAAHAATIPLPVKPCDARRVDESYPARGFRSIDNVFGTDWNQQEE